MSKAIKSRKAFERGKRCESGRERERERERERVREMFLLTTSLLGTHPPTPTEKGKVWADRQMRKWRVKMSEKTLLGKRPLITNRFSKRVVLVQGDCSSGGERIFF